MVDQGDHQQQASHNKRVKLSCFSLKHDDFVHDVQFDHYGRRIATCSSDQNIKIWERAADLDFADTSCNRDPASQAPREQLAEQIADEMLLTNQWVCTFQIPSKHNGAIWRIAWADPEFGQIIASCGMDQHVLIFKECESGLAAKQNNHRWRELRDVVQTGRTWDFAWRTDINAPIEDIKFAPKSLGLVLSVACSDGSVRFFAPASPTNLNDWQVTLNQIKKFTAGCSCLAWNPAFDEKPLILCGYAESSNPRNNPSANSEEVDSQDCQLLLYRLSGVSQSQQQFQQYGTQGQFQGHVGSINDVAWAPLAGRSFHLIATSATDKRIIVWRMKVVDLFSEQPEQMFDEPQVQPIYQVGPSVHQHQMVSVPRNPNADQMQQQPPSVFYPNVLRLKWNVTGTCFAGSAEDGTVSVWQRTMHSPEGFTKVAGIKSR